MQVLFVLLSLALSIAALPFSPLPYTQDPWYEQPANISSYKTGEVIKKRQAPSAIRSIYVTIGIKSAWQYAVRSEDTFGNPQAIFTMVIEPFNADSSKLLSYQYGQDSASLDCSPTYTLLQGARIDALYANAESVAMDWALQEGWYVNVPDHLGPKAAFTVGPQGGKAVLNSIRAALKSGPETGLKSDAKVIMWGFSGGTIPTGWGASMLPHYAPDLEDNLIGASVGGWVVNVTATAVATDGSGSAGLIPNAVNGIIHEFPEIDDTVYSRLDTRHAAKFRGAQDLCLIPSSLTFENTQFFSGSQPWFKGGFEVLHEKNIQDVLTKISLGLSPDVKAPKIPMYVYHSKSDNVVPWQTVEDTYNKFCDAGASSIEFHQYINPNHLFTFIEGAVSSLKWISDLFDGKTPVQGCKKIEETLFSEVDGAAVTVTNLISTILTMVTGQSFGSNPASVDVNLLRDRLDMIYKAGQTLFMPEPATNGSGN